MAITPILQKMKLKLREIKWFAQSPSGSKMAKMECASFPGHKHQTRLIQTRVSPAANNTKHILGA